ncbi:MAG: hypothetical protein HEQ24_15535 [Dolichospermum sp. BR01]|nr:hypothetical protein [Dolichospermum sp. BR01]
MGDFTFLYTDWFYCVHLLKAGAIKDLETAKQLYQQQGNTQNAQKVQKILNKL